MTISTWPTSINSRFFGYSDKPKDNVQIIEYISGRTVAYRKNTKAQKAITCKIRFTKAELNIFWMWFNDVIGQCSGAWSCPALGDGLFRFTSIPDPQDTEQMSRTLSLEIEEVL